MIKNYSKNIDELKDQILFITDDDSFIMVKILQERNLKQAMIYHLTKKLMFQCV